MVSFQSARKISNYLVRERLYLFQRRVGSFNCERSRFQACLNLNETDTGKIYKINHKIDCSDKYLKNGSFRPVGKEKLPETHTLRYDSLKGLNIELVPDQQLNSLEMCYLSGYGPGCT